MLKRFSLSLLIIVVIIIGGACNKTTERIAEVTPTPTPSPTPGSGLTANIKYTENNIDQILESDVDINPSTLELNFKIALDEYKDRIGGLPIQLRYNSKVWRMDFLKVESGTSANTTKVNPKFAENSVSGWTTSLDEPYVEYTARAYDDKGNPYCSECGVKTGVHYTERVAVHLPGGNTHILGKQTDDPIIKPAGEKITMSGIYVSIDGSRIKYNSDENIIYFPDGSRYLLSQTEGARYIDRQGNTRIYNRLAKQWTDTNGRNWNLALDNSEAKTQIVTLPGVSGMGNDYQFVWRNLSEVLTARGELSYTGDYNCTSNTGLTPYLFKSPNQNEKSCGSNNVFNPIVLSEIILPSHQSYIFTYNTYGEIDKIVLPTGGYHRYVYGNIPAIDNDLQTLLYGQANRGVINKFDSVLGNGSDEERWRYSIDNSNNKYIVKTISPDATKIERTLYSSTVNVGFGIEDQRYGKVSDERYYGDYLNMVDLTHYYLLDRRVFSKYDVTAIDNINNLPPIRNPHLTKQVEVDIRTRVAKTLTKSYDLDLNIVSNKQYDFVSITGDIAFDGSIDTTPIGSLLREDEMVFFVNDQGLNQDIRTTYRNLNLIALQTKSIIKDGSGAVLSATHNKYDEPAYHDALYGIKPSNWTDPGLSSGNITTVRKWLSNSPIIYSGWKGWSDATYTWIETHTWYDQVGNVTKTKDANGNESTFGYSDNYKQGGSNNTYAYLTNSTNALGHITTLEYEYRTGLITRITDPNGSINLYEYYHPSNRSIQKIIAAWTDIQSESLIQYANNTVIKLSDLSQYSDHKLRREEGFDGFGNIKETRDYEMNADFTGAIINTSTKYDNMGRVSSKSTPHRTGEVIEWTKYKYDSIGGLSTVELPDRSTISYFYGDNITAVRDETGKSYQIYKDALGRITKQIINPGTLNGNETGGVTNYSVDAIGNIRKVQEGQQTRTFVYDSLSRLLSESNPESSTTNYSYDSNGNLLEKTDARGVKTMLAYDELNRIKAKAYSGTTDSSTEIANNTLPVRYYYDKYGNLPSDAPVFTEGAPKGRLLGVIYGVGTDGTYYKYDQLGRIITNTQRVSNKDYPTSYEYNLADDVLYELRDNRRNSMLYDVAGRLTTIFSSAYPYDQTHRLVSQIKYTAFGAIQSESYDNGLIHTIDYNNRQQPTKIRLGHPDVSLESVFKLDLLYGTAFNPNDPDSVISPGLGNNGNIARSKYYINGTLQYSQTFQYDRKNRITYAVEHNNGIYNNDTQAWFQTFDYDNYGNRGINIGNTSDNADAGDSALQLADFSAINNRIIRSGYTYDAVGNLIAEPGKSYAYDAENRLVSIVSGDTIQYVYDGNGRRVKEIIPGNSAIRFVYSADGELQAEYKDSDGIGIKEYIYKDGKLFVSKGLLENYVYATSDYQGSVRVSTDWTGNIVASGRHDYMPFGEELFNGYGNRTLALNYPTNIQDDGFRFQFNGKERDAKTGLDWFRARYYRSTHGRFLSPNQTDIRLTNPAYPQQWNRYSFFPNPRINK